jgi:hypothetical protein
LKGRFRDLLAAFSLANLSLIGWWDGLLNYTSSQAFFLEHAPPRTEYLAAFTNVFLIGIVFYLLIRLARRIASLFGNLGLIFGSIPLLLLIAVPVGKSLVRLIVNRFQDADAEPRFVVFLLVTLLAVTAVVARQRLFLFFSAVLVTISPLIPIEAVMAASRCWTARPAEYADGPLAPRVPQNSLPRVVWMIFDELDYRLSFPDRPATVSMHEFDRLQAESLFAENAFSPAGYTQLSIPCLLTGKMLIDVDPIAPRLAQFDGESASTIPTIFSAVHAMGGNAAVVGWYFPYCRLFSQDLAACSSHDMQNELSETNFTFKESLIYQLQSLFAYGYRSILGESPRSAYRVKMLDKVHEAALRDVADPGLNLVFLHLPVPHAPHLYDRFTYTFPKRSLSTGTYLDSLALADTYLGDIRDAMTGADLWDRTTVIVSSDHHDRSSLAVDGKEDPRVPFLLKLAGQTAGVTYTPPLGTVETKSLVESILKGEIKTSEEAEKWLSTKIR